LHSLVNPGSGNVLLTNEAKKGDIILIFTQKDVDKTFLAGNHVVANIKQQLTKLSINGEALPILA